MISVVLYGRNDNYGYNLHKRAALSLNCFAELLEDRDDEILFVDYNTPDDHPTFVEAIRDTLTSQARRFVKVLRVRSSVHQRWASRTHLNALEPQARNIAIRRANPANRWILSTNTDIILVPRDPADSLSKLAARLADGFYELPRFEIPENVWEAFDRLDPTGVIKQIKQLAPTLWLDEVVYGMSCNVFDGPGDFQLMLRDDIVAIDGFDEAMIQGWHVDSNLCRRMELHRQEPNRSLLDELYAYHCDHTRQVTPAHGVNRTENDWAYFVTDIEDPRIPGQRESWGVPDVDIEEIRFDDDPSDRFIAVLQRILPALPDGARMERTYTEQTHDQLQYTPEHILPFLLGLFADQPRDLTLLWTGCRVETLDLFARAWKALGFKAPVLVDEACAAAASATAGEAISTSEFMAALARSNCVVLEYGDIRPGTERNAAAAGALAHIRGRFKEVDAAESISTAAPKLVVIVNGVHTHLEGFTAPVLGAAHTPFSTGVRHGFIRRSPTPSTSLQACVQELQASLGRAVALAPTEANLLFRTVSDLAHHRAPPLDPRPIAWELGVVASTKGVGALLGLKHTQLAQVRQELEGMRASASLRRPPTREPVHPRRGLCRVAGIEDWDDPEWAASARRAFGWGGGQECYTRNWFLWERIHLVHGLRMLGVTGRGRRALLALHEADPVVQVLTDLFDEVHLIAADPSLDVSHPFLLGVHVDHLAVCENQPPMPPIHVHAAELTRHPPPLDHLDAVVLNYAAVGGLALAGERLVAATRFLRRGGVVAFQLPLLVDGPFHSGALPLDMAVNGRLPAALAELALEVAGPFEGHLSSRTLDHVNEPDDGDPRFPGVLWRSEGRFLTTSIWFAVKGDGNADEGAFHRAFGADVAAMVHSVEARPTSSIESPLSVRGGGAYMIRAECVDGGELDVELSLDSGPVERQTVSVHHEKRVALLAWSVPDEPVGIRPAMLTVTSRRTRIRECSIYRVG
jgi:hypothetical protein